MRSPAGVPMEPAQSPDVVQAQVERRASGRRWLRVAGHGEPRDRRLHVLLAPRRRWSPADSSAKPPAARRRGAAPPSHRRPIAPAIDLVPRPDADCASHPEPDPSSRHLRHVRHHDAHGRRRRADVQAVAAVQAGAVTDRSSAASPGPADRPDDLRGGAPRLRPGRAAARASSRCPPGDGSRASGVASPSAGTPTSRAGRRRAGALPPAAHGSPRFLAYLPEGPVIDWDSDPLEDWLTPMVAHLKAHQALRHPHGPAGGDPPLGRRLGQGRRRRPAGPASRRRAADRAGHRRGPGGLPAARARMAAAGRRGRLRRRAAAVQLLDPAARRRRRAAHRGRRAQGHEPAVAPQHQEGRQGGRRHRPGRRRRREPPAVPRPLRAHRASATTSRRGRCRTSGRCSTRSAPRTRTGSRCSPPSTRATSSPRRSWSGRRPRLVLLRRLVDREARRPRLQRRPVGDDPARPGARRRRLRPARHHRHPRRGRRARRPDPVQGRHRRRGRRVRRRVGPAGQPPAVQGVHASTWRAGADAC